MFYSNGLAEGWPNVRLLGVLQRIAICYLITSILFMHFRMRGLVIITAVLLVGYWAWLSFIPVPDLGACSFAPGKNWSNYLDARFLPGRKYDGTWDPEGYLSTLPAIGTCVLGVLAGLFLQNQKVSPRAKVGGLITLLYPRRTRRDTKRIALRPSCILVDRYHVYFLFCQA